MLGADLLRQFKGYHAETQAAKYTDTGLIRLSADPTTPDA